MPRDQLTRVLYPSAALEHRFREVTELGKYADESAEDDYLPVGASNARQNSCQYKRCGYGCAQASQCPFPGFTRAYR